MIAGVLQIQAYKRLLSASDLSNALILYKQFLEKIGYVAGDISIETWLSQFNWDVLEDFGFGDSLDSCKVIIGNEEFRFIPTVIGLNKTQSPDDTHWLEIDLYFDIESLIVFPQGYKYRPQVGQGVWQLMRVCSTFFPEIGVYLTDEVDDAKSWSALLGGEDRNAGLWAFDLALIPHHLSSHFSPVPNTHTKAVFEFGLGFARIDRWVVLPWDTDITPLPV